MGRVLKIVGVVFAVLVVIVGLWATDNFIYPFKSVSPNYSDVEAAFAKLQFPAEWKEISSSENRGIHGRDCDPFNTAGCFHKTGSLSVPDNLSNDDVKAFMIASGCPGVVVSEFTYGGEEKRSFGFNCGLGNGVQLGASLRGPEASLSVTVKTY